MPKIKKGKYICLSIMLHNIMLLIYFAMFAMGGKGVEGANSNPIINFCRSVGLWWKWGGRSRHTV